MKYGILSLIITLVLSHPLTHAEESAQSNPLSLDYSREISINRLILDSSLRSELEEVGIVGSFVIRNDGEWKGHIRKENPSLHKIANPLITNYILQTEQGELVAKMVVTKILPQWDKTDESEGDSFVRYSVRVLDKRRREINSFDVSFTLEEPCLNRITSQWHNSSPVKVITHYNFSRQGIMASSHDRCSLAFALNSYSSNEINEISTIVRSSANGRGILINSVENEDIDWRTIILLSALDLNIYEEPSGYLYR